MRSALTELYGSRLTVEALIGDWVRRLEAYSRLTRTASRLVKEINLFTARINVIRATGLRIGNGRMRVSEVAGWLRIVSLVLM